MGIRDYSTNPADNTAINGQVVSDATNVVNIDNIIRELMADLAAFASDTPQLGTDSSVTSDWTVSGNWNFSGNPTFSGNPVFTGSPDFSGVANGPSILSALGLVGLVAPFAMQTAPSGWLECNGSAVSRTTYANLFSAIGTTYGVGDGSTTFNLPDLRGEFVRGWDNGRGVDASRAFGSFQDHALEDHRHSFDGSSIESSPNEEDLIQSATDDSSRNSNPVGDVTGANAAEETRPRNVALLFCIKA